MIAHHDREDDRSAPRLTILTPTWNRAHLLPRLYGSIRSALPQNGAFEWLVVDDGSTDETVDLLSDWQAAADFDLKMLRIDHGGKHRALKAGLFAARGAWIAIVDSDDWLFADAWQTICDSLDQADRLGAAVAFFPIDVVGREKQHGFSRAGACVTLAQRLNSEPAFDSTIVLRRDIGNMYVPEIAGEDFIAEGALIYGLGRGMPVLLGEAPFVAVEYQPGGLSHTMLAQRMRSPKGAMLTAQIVLHVAERRNIVVRGLANYARFWWHAVLQCRRPFAPVTWAQALTIPLGLPLALADFWRTRGIKAASRADR